MEGNETEMGGICRSCGCKQAQAAAEARTLGFQSEFTSAVYNCCQIIQWSDEQWLAWAEAAAQDGKLIDEVTEPLERQSKRAGNNYEANHARENPEINPD